MTDWEKLARGRFDLLLHVNPLVEALRRIRNSRHGPGCPGFGGANLRFQCTCHVAEARDALNAWDEALK